MPDVTYTIQPAKYTDFKEGFLEDVPVPTDNGGTPIMSEGDWIVECGKRYFILHYKIGKKKLAQKQAIIDDDIIE